MNDGDAILAGRMMEKLVATKAKLIAARYGNPARGMTLLFVAGTLNRATTIRFLEGILRESGKSPVSLLASGVTSGYDLSTSSFFERLSSIKKSGGRLILIEATPELLATGALSAVVIDSLIMTNSDTSLQPLLDLAPRHVVVPSNVSILEGSIEPYQHISYGEDDTADARIDAIVLYRHGSELSMTIDHQTKLDVATHLVGIANTRSLAVAVAAAYVLGVELSAVQEGVADIEAEPGNFEWISRAQAYSTVLVAEDGGEAHVLAAESVKQLAKRRVLIAVSECKDIEMIDQLKKLSDRLFVVGMNQPREGIDSAASADEAREKIARAARQGDIVLLLGSAFAASTVISLDGA